jgi:hypothetical protein
LRHQPPLGLLERQGKAPLQQLAEERLVVRRQRASPEGGAARLEHAEQLVGGGLERRVLALDHGPHGVARAVVEVCLPRANATGPRTKPRHHPALRIHQRALGLERLVEHGQQARGTGAPLQLA